MEVTTINDDFFQKIYDNPTITMIEGQKVVMYGAFVRHSDYWKINLKEISAERVTPIGYFEEHTNLIVLQNEDGNYSSVSLDDSGVTRYINADKACYEDVMSMMLNYLSEQPDSGGKELYYYEMRRKYVIGENP